MMPRKASRQSRPASLRVPPLISRLVTWQRMSFSEPLVCSGISGLSSTLSNSALLARRRASKTVEGGEAGLAAEDAIEPRRQGRLARRGWMAAPSLETAVEQPDQAADAALRGALGVGERIELVNQALGMNPAEAMRADIELAGVVADDHGIGEQAMRLDAAPQSAFGGESARDWGGPSGRRRRPVRPSSRGPSG